MPTFDSRSVQRNYGELNRRAMDLVEGRGSQLSRRLTKEMLKAFPSVSDLVPSEYQQRLQQILNARDL